VNKHIFLFLIFSFFLAAFLDSLDSDFIFAGFLYNTAKIKSPAQIPNSKYAKIKRNEKQDKCRSH